MTDEKKPPGELFELPPPVDGETIEALKFDAKNFNYWYWAHIVRVIDGDSLIVNVDLGFNVWHRHKYVQLADFDAWEPSSRPANITDMEWDEHKSKGAAATLFTESILPPGAVVLLNTHRAKNEDYGKLTASVFKPRKDGSWLDLAAALRVRGYEKK